MILGVPSSAGGQGIGGVGGGKVGSVENGLCCVCMCVCSWDLEKSVGRWQGDQGGQSPEFS